MGSRTVHAAEYRKAMALGLGVSVAVHAGLLAMTFEVVPFAGEPAPAEDRVRFPETSRAMEVIRLAERRPGIAPSTARNRRFTSRPGSSPGTTALVAEPSPSGSAHPSARPGTRTPRPALEISDREAVAIQAGLASAVLDRLVLSEKATNAPATFADLTLTSPEPPEAHPNDGDGSGDDDGGWLSGIAGIFGDIGVSLDGGICPLPRGRAGWR